MSPLCQVLFICWNTRKGLCCKKFTIMGCRRKQKTTQANKNQNIEPHTLITNGSRGDCPGEQGPLSWRRAVVTVVNQHTLKEEQECIVSYHMLLIFIRDKKSYVSIIIIKQWTLNLMRAVYFHIPSACYTHDISHRVKSSFSAFSDKRDNYQAFVSMFMSNNICILLTCIQ